MKSRAGRARVAVTLIAAGFAMLFQLSAAGVSAAPRATTATAYKIAAVHVIDLPLAQRYYVEASLPRLRARAPVDRRGVPLYRRDGELYYHPVVLAQRALALIEGYQQTGDSRYLSGARVVAKRLVAESTVVDGARYLPYKFDFPLHGLSNDVMQAPWYSGMAEGQALSVFSRLHALLGRAADLEIAASLFKAIQVHGTTGPWVSHVDSAGYLWIQEFPKKGADYTLNGFVFALFGLYDYYEETGAAEVHKMLLGGLTTVLHYLPDFRNPGGISYYCLSHHVRSLKYHNIHVAQLRMLARMTESPVFARYATLFDADA